MCDKVSALSRVSLSWAGCLHLTSTIDNYHFVHPAYNFRWQKTLQKQKKFWENKILLRITVALNIGCSLWTFFGLLHLVLYGECYLNTIKYADESCQPHQLGHVFIAHFSPTWLFNDSSLCQRRSTNLTSDIISSLVTPTPPCP